MRLIVEDALAMVKFHGYPEIEITPSDVNAEAYKRGWNDAIDAIIESTPSIDAVPVVRCKDCKHCIEDKGDLVSVNVCELNHNKVQPDDWFCADGEREQNG